MKSACMASMYHNCGYHDNCPKSADTWCQYQKDKQDNTNYYKSKRDLPIDVRRVILRINLFGSLRRWRNVLMAKPKTITNRLTG